MSTDRFSFVYDPNGSATEPVAIRRYGSHDGRVSVEDARRMYRELDDVLSAERSARLEADPT